MNTMLRLATNFSTSSNCSVAISRRLTGRLIRTAVPCLTYRLAETLPNASQMRRYMSSAARHDNAHSLAYESRQTQEMDFDRMEILTEKSTAKVVNDGRGIQIHFHTTENGPSFFHGSWLWANDPNIIHPTSGQRTRSVSTFLYGWKIENVSIIRSADLRMMKQMSDEALFVTAPPPRLSLHPVGTVYQLDDDKDKNDNNKDCPHRVNLHVTWYNQRTGERSTSLFDLDWLESCRYDETALRRRLEETSITRETTLKRGDTLDEVDFDEWNCEDGKDYARYKLLDSVFRLGAALVKGVPLLSGRGDDEAIVGAVGKSLSGGALSHGNLYGNTFHVQSELGATNIASTKLELPPHHDLAYYESKPGLQLLHCINNRGVSGGSSTLIDALAAARAFREMAPDLYETLLQCEATFLKQRMNADMVYRIPHIQEDSSGSIVRVHWSPPFEGPLCLHPSKVDDYVLAYAAFERLLDKSLPRDSFMLPLAQSLEQQFIDYAHQNTWEHRLEMGEILIFSNQRMLHGRGKFEVSGSDPNNGRHLVGCYTNIDDTLNEYRVLRRNQLLKSDAPLSRYVRVAGNGSGGTI